jgi:outer membrane protein OmpA-like peptidoglycan-associated protein
VAPNYDLDIEGHTDNVGSDSYNQSLSERRAQSVAQYLRTCGLTDQITGTKGFGESQPIAANTDTEGRDKNRRVEIVVNDTDAVVAE